MITLVVFSKDRAMQLDSLLQSVKDHCTGVDRTLVIAHASSNVHDMAYKSLGEHFDDSFHMMLSATTIGEHLCDAVNGVIGRVRPDSEEDDEKLRTLMLRGGLSAPDHIALAVDDQIFYRRSDFTKATTALEEHLGFVWSWRLGNRAPAAYCPCPIEGYDPHWLCSPFVDDPDYRYLFHSDGALYKTTDYVSMLDKYLPDWKTGKHTPNDLEAAVAGRRAEWAPTVGPHLGPLAPTCITWQLNRVQTKYGSPAVEIPETNLDALAVAYLAGKRVDNAKLYAALSEDATRFNPPGARPTHVYASEEASRFWASCVR